MTLTETLKLQHAEVLKLVNGIQEGLEKEDPVVVHRELERLRDALVAHLALEDSRLYPELEQLARDSGSPNVVDVARPHLVGGGDALPDVRQGAPRNAEATAVRAQTALLLLRRRRRRCVPWPSNRTTGSQVAHRSRRPRRRRRRHHDRASSARRSATSSRARSGHHRRERHSARRDDRLVHLVHRDGHGRVIIGQLCEALDYAHRLADENGKPLELVHRDVTPSNVMVTGWVGEAARLRHRAGGDAEHAHPCGDDEGEARLHGAGAAHDAAGASLPRGR